MRALPAIAIAVLSGLPVAATAQCANNNTLFGAAITPPCPGTTTTGCLPAGQYILVNVVTGNIYTFSACGPVWDSQMTLYNNGGGGSLGYNDDFCGILSTSQITWTATFTGQLRVLLDQWNCATSANCAPIVITCVPAPPPVTNNDPCGAIAVPVNTSCTMQTFTSAGSTITAIPPSPSCGLVTGGDVWFSFVAPASGMVIAEMAAGTLTDAVLAVYSATSCAAGFAEVGCDDDSGPGTMPYLNVNGLTPGATYYARVFGFLGTTGTFSICLRTIVPPVGDCIYTLNMFDSFGDGWNGSTVGVSINGGPFTNYTLPTGSNGVALIGLNIGDILVVQYTENSFFPGEISYSFTPGCIFSDGPTPATGIVFVETVDCIPAPAPPEDCAGAITICNNQAFNNNTQSTGCAADLDIINQGCLASAERQGTWYYFSPSSGGNIAMTIAPTDPLDDYDFAIWGPFANPVCPPPGAPTRCSYSALGGNTGLNYTALDNTETAAGDKWVNDLTVIAGQVYIMYISNFSQSGLAFDLNWNLANGASLDCTVLPVELFAFSAEAKRDHIHLSWSTATEQSNDHFVLERSADGHAFGPLGTVNGMGSTQTASHYFHDDHEPLHGLNYYRLRSVATDGSVAYSHTVVAVFGSSLSVNAPYPVPANGSVSVDVVVAAFSSTTLRVLDASGRVVREQVFELPPGPASLTLSLEGCDPGAYLLVLASPSGELLPAGRFVVP